MTSDYSDKGLELIVHAEHTFSGEGWVTYDNCYHRWAVVLKTLNWSQTDFNRYNEIFTGRAKPLAHCCYCMSENHCSHECRYAPVTDHPSVSWHSNRTSSSQSTSCLITPRVTCVDTNCVGMHTSVGTHPVGDNIHRLIIPTPGPWHKSTPIPDPHKVAHYLRGSSKTSDYLQYRTMWTSFQFCL